MEQIVIVDYGMGNIESVVNAFKHLGVNCVVSDEPESLKHAKGIVLPGVGAFHAAMQNLRERGFVDVLNEQILHYKKPFLGICLGMQLIAKDSIELQYSTGLGWIQGHILRIEPQPFYRVPHVGWNELHFSTDEVLFKKINEGAHFFFDHSYHLQCDPNLIIATCNYGGSEVVASIQKENIFAVQFHPEKSQRNGLKLLRNFLNMATTRLEKC